MIRRLRATVARWVTGSTPSLLTKAYAEFVGCMIFHFVGSASPTAFSNASALMAMVYYTAKISGGHLNPALTLSFALLGHTNPLEMVVYWAAQVAGCMAGALWLAALIPGARVGSSHPASAGCFEPSAGISAGRVWGWEAMCTFCFMVPIFSVVWYTQRKSGYGMTGPIMVGVSLYAAASAAAPWTGAALNPARALGSYLVFQCDGASSYPLAYVAGEMTAALLVPIAVLPWYGLSATPWWWLADSEAAASAAEHPHSSDPHNNAYASVAGSVQMQLTTPDFMSPRHEASTPCVGVDHPAEKNYQCTHHTTLLRARNRTSIDIGSSAPRAAESPMLQPYLPRVAAPTFAQYLSPSTRRLSSPALDIVASASPALYPSSSPALDPSSSPGRHPVRSTANDAMLRTASSSLALWGFQSRTGKPPPPL